MTNPSPTIVLVIAPGFNDGSCGEPEERIGTREDLSPWLDGQIEKLNSGWFTEQADGDGIVDALDHDRDTPTVRRQCPLGLIPSGPARRRRVRHGLSPLARAPTPSA